MPQEAAVSETNQVIEQSPELQGKFAKFQPTPDAPPQLVQTEKDQKKSGRKPDARAPEFDAIEKPEKDPVEGEQVEEPKREAVTSFNRENPFKKAQRLAKEKEQEAGEYKTRYEERDTQAKQLETELAEARTKLEEATTNKDRKDAQVEVQAIKDELAQVVEKTTQERKQLVSRLEYYNLTESPDFQRDYVAPVVEVYNEIAEMIGTDPEAQQLLAQALSANEATLMSTGDQSAQSRQVRDQLFSKLIENLPEFTKGQFNASLNDFIRKTKKQAEALRDHGGTRAQLKARGDEQRREAEIKHKKFWDHILEETSTQVDTAIPVNEELEEVIKKNKIPYDYEQDAALAKAMTTSATIPEREVARILNQGARFARATAYVKAQDIVIKEQAALIKKLRGSDPGNLGDRTSQHTSGDQGDPLASKLARHAPASR